MALRAAYGGAGWSPRTGSIRDERGGIWGDWGVSSECGHLRAVLLHRPGREIDEIVDFDAVQMRSDLSAIAARAQHDALADAYRAHGVAVHLVERGRPDKPNAMCTRPPASPVTPSRSGS